MIYSSAGSNGKPVPDIYITAMQRLGVTPDVTVGIEDSANGVRALDAANMYIIAAPSPDYPLPDEILTLADATIDSLEEFSVDLIEHLHDASS